MNYNSMIKEKGTVKNYEGAKAYAMTPEMELYTAVVTCAMSDKYYEENDERMERICEHPYASYRGACEDSQRRLACQENY